MSRGNPPSAKDDLLALDALINERLITGMRKADHLGIPFEFLSVRITITGREFLEQSEREEKDQLTLPMENMMLRQQIIEMGEIKHTLLDCWKSADLGERFGMVSFFGFVFMVGYLCAHERVISRFIDLIRSMKP